jgi:hypothetical protein
MDRNTRVLEEDVVVLDVQDPPRMTVVKMEKPPMCQG